MLPPDDEQPEGEWAGKQRHLRMPLRWLDFLGRQIDDPAMSDSQRVLLAILLQQHGRNPSWADDLDGHSTLGTFENF